VVEIMDRDVRPLPVERIEAGGLVGARTADWTVLFQRDHRRTDRLIGFRSDGKRFLVTDLAEGSWRGLRDGAVVSEHRGVSREEGTVWWSGPPGHYKLERQQR
jgi:hypothetical protein